MTKISVVMTVGAAVLTAHQGITITLENVKATDTLWDYFKNCYYHTAWEGTGIGPAFEKAEQEELERLAKEYESGRDPSIAKHLTFTLLKTGVYLGKDVVIGILYLPDAVWEYFTQEKEMEGYAQMQNELADAMRQMILDRKAFEKLMNDMKKIGLHNEDVLPFLNCMCSDCGGSLGGSFNPEFKSDLGHGPCQCNGPLTIWKTPLPVNNKKLQYDCFNQVTKMRYDEAMVIFEQWQKQLLLENAKSVQAELDSIKVTVADSQAMHNEETARKIANQFGLIKDLVFPQDADFVRAMVNPHLINHSGARLDDGNIQRAIDNIDLALETVGPRNPQQQFDLQQSKLQYEKWLKNWVDAKQKQFPKIDDYLRNNQIEKAEWEIQNLEYRMLKDPVRPLPPAIHDPEFIALKERVRQFQPVVTLPSKTKELDALQRDYQLAYERYTRLVTTGGSGNVQQALNEYRRTYERYTEAKKMQDQSGALLLKKPASAHDKIYKKVNLDNIGGVAGLRGSEITYNQIPLGGNSIDGGRFNLPWFGSNPNYSQKASVLVNNFSANVIYILADGAWFGHSLDGKQVLRVTVIGDRISHFDLVSGVHLSDHTQQPAKMPINTRKIPIKDQYNKGAFLTRFEMPLTKVTRIDVELLVETDQQLAIELFGITLGLEQQSVEKPKNIISQGLEFDIDRVGSDIWGITLPEANPVLCRDACFAEEKCRSWTYIKPNTIQGPNPRCWLKYAVPLPTASSCCVSGVR